MLVPDGTISSNKGARLQDKIVWMGNDPFSRSLITYEIRLPPQTDAPIDHALARPAEPIHCLARSPAADVDVVLVANDRTRKTHHATT